jgi:hypothetical protein
MRDATVAERVRAILTEEYEGHRCLATERCHSVIPGMATEREMDLLDWGLVYGLAHGILLAEAGIAGDPVELSREAHQAAREVYARWGGGTIAPRVTMSPLVDKALVAFEKAETPIMCAVYGHAMDEAEQEHVKALVERLNAIYYAIGIPEQVA